MNRRRRLSVWVTTALAVPLLATTACQSPTPPDQAAPTSDSSSPAAPDELGKMQKKVDDAQHAIDSADVNGNAENSGNSGNSANSGNSGSSGN
ncbi:hypothetical protein [Streptomyces tubercidicus]|uniref:Lipoprotein n=1 Tax=Streptomyces tubercidicus TaxID=47759 RepID=A0A640UVR4_9ACTN|nr:hypothetical protein [Streptomyces tubercidicus]WAU13222.1 hypothetical protein STRTU_003681 [Streptomyces tubercidicus]GFE38791.1 hypothetical protein Stube_34640 [Streptomyces tubercidicus]